MDTDEHMQTTTDPAAPAPDLGGSVFATTEVKPYDLVDAWWMKTAATRGYSEFTYAMRHTSLGELEPTMLEGLLPDGARIVRRAFLTTSQKQEAVVEFEGALAALSFQAANMWVGVAAHDPKQAAYVKDVLVECFPEVEKTEEEAEPEIPLMVWTSGRAVSAAPRISKLPVRPWETIADNYAPETRVALQGLFEGFEPGKGGKLVLWYGLPGTGKSHALAALAYAWDAWCATHYIADPEYFLGDTDYLLGLMTERPRVGRDWKLVIMEDTGELLTSDAHAQTGQALSRLLNVTDGMLGQNSNTLFLITTNEPVSSFHEAVSRPGRCASQVEFGAFPPEQARAWLRDHGADDEDVASAGTSTLADLYATLAGTLVSAQPHNVVGFAPPGAVA